MKFQLTNGTILNHNKATFLGKERFFAFLGARDFFFPPPLSRTLRGDLRKGGPPNAQNQRAGKRSIGETDGDKNGEDARGNRGRNGPGEVDGEDGSSKKPKSGLKDLDNG